MIDTPQWRASIGAFNSLNQCKKSVTSTSSYFIVINDTCYHNIIIWFALLYYVMNVSFCAMCLILSGDIENNPGPFHRICPECNGSIHIKKQVCSCGYIFCKKIKNFIKFTSPSVSTLNVKVSNACSPSPDITQTTGCASLSTSPFDVTVKSLDSTSIELVDDTAHDATSSTTVGETLNDTHSTSITKDPTSACNSSLPENSSTKWARRSAVVNEQRRLKYALNPKGK